MFPRVMKAIKNQGDAVRVEAIASDGDRHAAAIVLKTKEGREILAKTDATYETADEAVAAMKAALDAVRGEPATAPVDEVTVEAVEDRPDMKKKRKKGLRE